MAENIVEIKIKDKQDWVSITGISTNWANYSKKYKEERVQRWYLAPEIVTDVWNGEESDIQHTTWDIWYFQLFLKESEKKFIQQMKSTSDIEIIQYSDDNGTVINTTYTLDTRKSDYITISDPERVGDTTGSKVDIIFRTNRTIINKALPLDNINYISFQNNKWKNDFLGSVGDRVTKMTTTRVCTSTFGVLATYDIIANVYTLVGNSLDTSFESDISGLDNTSIAYINDLGALRKYSFDGTDWSIVGNTLDLGALTSARITSMSSTRVAIYDDTTGTLRAYDFDGTDWSLTGNALAITAGVSDITAMTALKVALIDPTSKELRDYDFDGTDFTVNEIIVTTLSTNVGIARLSDERVALISSGEDILKSYRLTSMWSLESGSINLGTANGIISEIDTDIVYVSASSNSGNYSHGIYNYYSDYDVLDWSKPTEDVNVEWFDNTIKTAQKTNKKGFQYLQYILTENHDDFIKYLKSSVSISINGIQINEVEFDEPSIIGEGLMKIIVRGVYETEVTTDYLNKNQDYSLSLNDGGGADLFYTDYQIEFVPETPEIDQVDNQTGIKNTSKAISKTVYSMRFYLTESRMKDLKSKFELYAETGIIEPGTISVLENREPSITKLGYDLWEVVVNCLTDVTIS